MSKELAKAVLIHLEKNNMMFCFLEDGRLVSREDCVTVIESFTATN